MISSLAYGCSVKFSHGVLMIVAPWYGVRGSELAEGLLEVIEVLLAI